VSVFFIFSLFEELYPQEFFWVQLQDKKRMGRVARLRRATLPILFKENKLSFI